MRNRREGEADGAPGHPPLAGLRVVELIDGKTEMFGRFLADLGADVLRIEPPGGSASRREPPCYDGVSLRFATHNAGKRSSEIDLETARGREQLLALLADADVLAESEPPGRLEALGLGVPRLQAANPQLIVTSITDFGQTGPYREWAATDLVHLALNSVLSRSGLPGQPPIKPPGRLASEVAAIQAVWATLVAVWERLANGVGDHVDVSILEASIQSFDPPFGIGSTATIGTVADDISRDRPDAAHRYPVFPCADGYVRICVLTARQWQNMLEWLGRPPELADPVWAGLLYRLENADFLHRYFAALVKDRTRAELIELGRVNSVPIEAVATPQQALASEHLRARGVWTPLTFPDGRSGLAPNGFAELDGSRLGSRTPAPQPGGGGAFTGPRISARQGHGRGPAEAGGPLRGIRVLDLGVVVVGAETARLFADLGADVVKVESRAYPDGGRQTIGMVPALAFGHRGKRSLGIDLRRADGNALFLELVARADVVCSNFRPGTMDRLGLSGAALRSVNPDIVVVESSALGSWGPASDGMGYGPLVRAATGLSSVWRYPDDPAGFCDNITVYPDHASSRIGAVIALALLIGGEGRPGGHATIAQAECILGQLSEYYLRESLEPGSFRALGNVGEFDAPAGVYPCAGDDEWCAVEVRGDGDWQRLCAAIGAPDLAADPALRTAAGRLVGHEQIEKRLAAWTLVRPPTEVAGTLQAYGVPAGMMLRPVELLQDPQLVSREFFLTLPQPELGDLPTETGPARFAGIGPPVPRPAPRFGQHSREVVRDWLGLPEVRIDELIRNGALEE